MKILVVAAHPDDEILGVGGTLLKHRAQGDEIYVCIMTKAFEPEWSREYMDQKVHEQKKIDELLSVTRRWNFNFLTTKLNTYAAGEVNKAVTDIVREIAPDTIYTHFEYDMNYDHTVTFQACMVAARPPQRIRLCCFETPSETEWNNKPFWPNYWVEISEVLDRKIEAFKVYHSEVKAYPHSRSPEGIRALARQRGSEIVAPHAEAFCVIKDYWM